MFTHAHTYTHTQKHRHEGINLIKIIYLPKKLKIITKRNYIWRNIVYLFLGSLVIILKYQNGESPLIDT